MTDTPHFAQQWLQPNWPAIDGVQALFTTRHGGHSGAPWDSLNLGEHVGDVPQHVAANRQVLAQAMCSLSGHPVTPVFLQQVHGCEVQVLAPGTLPGQAFDACVCDHTGVACTIMVADCLPLLLAHRSGQVVAAAHAGWRGLADGVIEATWQAYARKMAGVGYAQLQAQTQVWIGPCIGPQAFEVGPEVRQAFVAAAPQASACFAPSANPGKWLANLPQLARQRLQALGITQIYGNDASPDWCTVSNPSQFFSHRRDALRLGSTGRMAACIWKV